MIPMEINWNGDGWIMKEIEEKTLSFEDRMTLLDEALAQETPKSLAEKLEINNSDLNIPEICFKIADWWDGRKLQRRIVCAANRFQLKAGGQIVIPGARHYSPDMAAVIDLIQDQLSTRFVAGEEQGFIDQWGEYHNRKDALIIATHSGQINTVCEKGYPLDILFSEDLY